MRFRILFACLAAGSIGLAGCQTTKGAGGASVPSAAASLGDCPAPSAKIATTASGCSVYREFGPKTLRSQPPPSKVFVLMHGDVSRGGGKIDYIYAVAESYAARMTAAGLDDFAIVTPARQGFSDKAGAKSSGARLKRDMYPRRVVDQSAEFLAFVRSKAPAARITVVGHSGGAAIAGVIAGEKRGLADAYVFVGTPGDVPRWRREYRTNSTWPRSLSPHAVVASTDPAARYVVITGPEDDSTPMPLAQAYADLLKAAGREVELVSLPDTTHNQLMRRGDTVREIVQAAP
ncbi:MAG: hypothetical protein AAFW46_00870 [Pseudomonadota bacterium]